MSALQENGSLREPLPTGFEVVWIDQGKVGCHFCLFRINDKCEKKQGMMGTCGSGIYQLMHIKRGKYETETPKEG